jgi:hypothetical protein
MMNGRNNGKKAMAVRIVAHAFEIVRFPFNVYDLPLGTDLRRIGQPFNFRPDTWSIISSMIRI